MNPWPVEAAVPRCTCPAGARRPGGDAEVRLSDVRNILERASARETAARVAGGAVAKAFLASSASRCSRT